MADTCASLAGEITALRAEVAKLQSVTESKVRAIVNDVLDNAKPGIISSTKSVIEPGLLSVIAGAIAVAVNKFQPQIDQQKADISKALRQVRTVDSDAKNREMTEQERVNKKMLDEKRALDRAMVEADERRVEANKQLAEAEKRARQGLATDFDKKIIELSKDSDERAQAIAEKVHREIEEIKQNAAKRAAEQAAETKHVVREYAMTEEEKRNKALLEERYARERGFAESREMSERVTRELAEAEERARQGIATEFDKNKRRIRKSRETGRNRKLGSTISNKSRQWGGNRSQSF